MCENDSVMETKFNQYIKKLNTKVLTIEPSKRVLAESTAILNNCNFSISNQYESLMLMELNKGIDYLYKMFMKYYLAEPSEISITESVRVIIKNYGKGLKNAEQGNITIKALVEQRAKSLKTVEVAYDMNANRDFLDLELIRYCTLTYKAEMYCDYIAMLKKILDGDKFMPLLISNKLQYLIAKRIYPQVSELCEKLQQCLRGLTTSDVTLLIRGKEMVNNIIINTITDCTKLLEHDERIMLGNLKFRLKIKD